MYDGTQVYMNYVLLYRRVYVAKEWRVRLGAQKCESIVVMDPLELAVIKYHGILGGTKVKRLWEYVYQRIRPVEGVRVTNGATVTIPYTPRGGTGRVTTLSLHFSDGVTAQHFRDELRLRLQYLHRRCPG